MSSFARIVLYSQQTAMRRFRNKQPFLDSNLAAFTNGKYIYKLFSFHNIRLNIVAKNSKRLIQLPKRTKTPLLNISLVSQNVRKGQR
ncbi:unnamed protein product [Leptidea sinapis]|uniref:Uncharacterized protein n=1 Tax=Leptidea sinapis TaxID=189913 RepID=A0A5E4QYF2_9NEOP|nr:unnamed protein product [Leptidea sinapis]